MSRHGRDFKAGPADVDDLTVTTPAPRLMAAVAGGSATFGAAGSALLLIAAAARRSEAVRMAPAYARSIDDARAAHPEITIHDPGLLAMVPNVADVLGPTLRLGAALTAVVCAVLVLAAVLVAHHRTGWAVAACTAAVLSVVAAGGPLSLLVPTIPVYPSGTAPLPSYDTPLWWRGAVGAGLALLLLTMVVTMHKLGDGPVRALPALLPPGAALVAGVVALVLDPPLTDGSGAGGLSWSVLCCSLLLVACATAAGCCLSGGGSLALSAVVAAAAFAEWKAVARPGGAPLLPGWELMGAPPAYGSFVLTLAVVAAPVAGGAATWLLHRRRPALVPLPLAAEPA